MFESLFEWYLFCIKWKSSFIFYMLCGSCKTFKDSKMIFNFFIVVFADVSTIFQVEMK